MPRFMTKGGPLLATEYRQRFGNGILDAVGSINYSNAQSATDTHTSDRLRGHINATGVWDLDETYRSGFDLQRVSDQTYLLRFGFGVPLLNAMISRAYLQGFEPRAMTDVFAYAFQPLLPGLSSATQPIVLPVANRAWVSEPDPLGGRWFLNGNMLNIVRETGTQTRRISLGSRWDKNIPRWYRRAICFSASLRGDAYSVNNLSQISNPDLPSAYFPLNGMPAAEPINSNFLAGARLSAARADLELSAGASRRRTHRDRRADRRRLCRTRWRQSAPHSERGQPRLRTPRHGPVPARPAGRVRRARYRAAGRLRLEARVYNKDGGNYRLLIGQSYRAQPNPFLPLGSGAAERLSDVVGRVVASPSSYLDLIYRFRLTRAI